MPKRESPERDNSNIIDFSAHQRRKGETRNAMGSFRESFYSRQQAGAKSKKDPVTFKHRAFVGLQFAVVLVGVAIAFHGCFNF